MLDPFVIEGWEPADISRWLKVGGYEDVAELVTANQVNGIALQHLKSDGWQELGVHSAVRRAKILAHLWALQRNDHMKTPSGWNQSHIIDLDEVPSSIPKSLDTNLLTEAIKRYSNGIDVESNSNPSPPATDIMIRQLGKLIKLNEKQLDIMLKRPALDPSQMVDWGDNVVERMDSPNITGGETLQSFHTLRDHKSMLGLAMQWGDAQEVRELIKQAMSLSSYSFHSDGSGHHLPDIPPTMRLLLFFAGVLPRTDAVVWKDHVYNMYYYFLRAILCMILSKYIWDSVVTLVVLHELPLVSGALLNLQLFIIIPHWRVWKSEFSKSGLSIDLMRQISQCGFYMKYLSRSSFICWCGVFFVFAMTISVNILLYFDGSRVAQLLAARTNHVGVRKIGEITLVLDNVFVACEVWWLSVAITHVWFVHIVSHFHRHNLLCYATAFARAIEEREPSLDIVSALDKLERSVTSKLRAASSSWVRFVAIIAVFMVLGITLSVMMLVTFHLETVHAVMFCSMASLGVVCVICLGFPLASVAETHEYDVLRALNSPKVLSRAQRYFGQQLLPHLHTLEWGFRFGGAVITSRKVLNICAALLVTVIAAVGRAIVVKVVVISE